MTDIADLGIRQVREVVSPGPWWDPLGDSSDLSPIAEKIQRADYVRKFAAFRVVNLSVFETVSFDPAGGPPVYAQAAKVTPQYLEAVRNEHSNGCYAATRLSAGYGTLIRVGNWEAAHMFPPDADWTPQQDGGASRAMRYFQARIDGCNEGRARALAEGYRGKVQIFFEYVYQQSGPRDDGTPGTVSDMVEGLRNLRGVDLWSYSSWESILYGDDIQATALANANSFRAAIATFKDVCSALLAGDSCRFMIGEFGYQNTREENPAVLQAIVNTTLDEGAEAVVSWILYDDPSQGAFGFFGSYDSEHQLTRQGEMFRKLLLVSRPRRR